MKNFLTQNIDKYGIINLIIWVSIPVILAIIIYGKNDIPNNYNYDSQQSSESTTTTTTKKRCKATPCPNYAEDGSDYCSIHKKGKTKKCAQCGKPIWDDEVLCDECLYGDIIKSKSK